MDSISADSVVMHSASSDIALVDSIASDDAIIFGNPHPPHVINCYTSRVVTRNRRFPENPIIYPDSSPEDVSDTRASDIATKESQSWDIAVLRAERQGNSIDAPSSSPSAPVKYFCAECSVVIRTTSPGAAITGDIK